MTTPRRRDTVLEVLRRGGAGLLFGIGGIHLDLWITGYRHIGTVGELFLVQVIVSFLLGIAITISGRWWLAVGGALFAVGTLAGYELFRIATILGFHELRTTAGFTAGVLEVLAFVALGGYALLAQQRSSAPAGPPRARVDRLMAVTSGRLAIAGAVVAVVLVALVGISAVPRHGTTGSAGAGGRPGVTIVIQGFAFMPDQVSVSPGEVVEVVNKDGVTHTLTSTSGPARFDTGDISPGGSTTFKAPSVAGTYHYICTIHTFMKGVLTVT